MRRLPSAALALSCVLVAAAHGEPSRIGGHDAAWWGAAAYAHEAEVQRIEAELAACEERAAPPAYRNVPGQVFRGRDGLRTREVLRCDDTRAALESARDAAEEFEELARRLEVPPGWLR